MAKLKLSQDQQEDILSYVGKTYQSWSKQLKNYKNRMETIYDEVTTFVETKANSWDTEFKVNKLFEAENKVLPRIIANNPKRLVSLKSDEFNEGDDKLDPAAKASKMKIAEASADAVRDYLSRVFEKQDLTEVVKLWAKNMVRYGLGWSKVSYKYELVSEKISDKVTEIDEEGNEIELIEEKTKENVVSEYPTIDIVSWSSIYYDPRYIRLEDMPGIIDVKDGIRQAFFTKDPKKYLNIDKLKQLGNTTYDDGDAENYKQAIYNITGIQYNEDGPIDMNNLTVRKFYGRYEVSDDPDKDGSGEKMYEFWSINDMLLIYAREITHLPFESIKSFEDTESHLAVGFLENIVGVTNELNFKKNRASLYLNQSLARNFVWSPQSGINPKHLNSSPGNIIPTTKDGVTAMSNLQELPFRALPANYFQEQNDFERQIQSSTFTIDTTTPQGNQALTNTATGIKVKAFESNSVINMVRKNFEDGMVRIAYKFLQATFENQDDNIIIKKFGGKGFQQINKEVMRDAIRRYDIKIEAGSSSFDSEEQRRANGTAQWNLSLSAAQAGVPVDMAAEYVRLMGNFEGVNTDKLLKPVDPLQQQEQQGGGPVALPKPATDPSNIPV